MESTATLQIDAPSETVSLVDPRISRDGVPLCARHADATTPPMGWTMNDLRSRGRSLSAVPDEGSVPTSTPPRVRPPEDGAARHMSKRQSISERAGQATDETAEDGDDSLAATADERPDSKRATAEAGARSTAAARSATDDDVDGDGDAPASRPKRRRDVAAEDETEQQEEQFAFHFGFKSDEDEPAELQASSPLLSRAFRATTG
jgi:hypothetical protein